MRQLLKSTQDLAFSQKNDKNINFLIKKMQFFTDLTELKL